MHDFEDFCNEAAELYAEYCREDQHKIAVDMALEWAAENAAAGQGMSEHGDHLEPFVYKQSILKGKTDKSLQYENNR